MLTYVQAAKRGCVVTIDGAISRKRIRWQSAAWAKRRNGDFRFVEVATTESHPWLNPAVSDFRSPFVCFVGNNPPPIVFTHSNESDYRVFGDVAGVAEISDGENLTAAPLDFHEVAGAFSFRIGENRGDFAAFDPRDREAPVVGRLIAREEIADCAPAPQNRMGGLIKPDIFRQQRTQRIPVPRVEERRNG